MDKDAKVSIISEDCFEYPDASKCFRPAINYPEYPFVDGLFDRRNKVYDMVRRALLLLEMDNENFGRKNWNPLKNVVSPGDRVLIKPNMVLHRNYNSSAGLDCLVTNPSVVAAVIDYVVIALKGVGKIVVADAPLQECDFNTLVLESGYRELVDYYKRNGIEIEIKDLRNVKTFTDNNGVHHKQQNTYREDNRGVLVSLNEMSSFAGLDESRLRRMRVTDYDHNIMNAHHGNKRHEYMVSEEVLLADVVINMPKPKTHRKAGVTISLKNLIGINTNKEYLPHHTIGSKDEGGDCYMNKNYNMEMADKSLDRKDEANTKGSVIEEEAALNEFVRWLNAGKNQGNRYYEGSWYGNDTIWRTISDLNKILFFAGKDGSIRTEAQRKELIVADMVISGEKEGPLAPSRVETGIIAAGLDPVWFDRVICHIMGFNFNLIPSLNCQEYTSGSFRISSCNGVKVTSNNKLWDGKRIGDIVSVFDFIPTKGWECLLGNRKKEALLHKLKDMDKDVYVFGAGEKGIDLCQYITEMKSGIRIRGIFDNDKNKYSEEFLPGICCIKPELKDNAACIIAVSKIHTEVIKKQMQDLGYRHQDLLIWYDEMNEWVLCK